MAQDSQRGDSDRNVWERSLTLLPSPACSDVESSSFSCTDLVMCHGTQGIRKCWASHLMRTLQMSHSRNLTLTSGKRTFFIYTSCVSQICVIVRNSWVFSFLFFSAVLICLYYWYTSLRFMPHVVLVTTCVLLMFHGTCLPTTANWMWSKALREGVPSCPPLHLPPHILPEDHQDLNVFGRASTLLR